MKRIKKIFLILLLGILYIPSVKAATGNISVSGASTVVVGNKITVTVTLSSGTAIGSWQMNLNYDKSYLQLLSSTAENQSNRMVNSSPTGVKYKSYTFTFKALKSGSTMLSVGSYLAYDYDTISEMSLTSSGKSIKIITQQQLEASYSKDNYLKSLSVDGYTLNPEFNKDTLEYNIDVPTGTTKVKINALVNDNKSSVTGAGEISVSEGLNTIPITVTAQNGSTRTYNLTINVEDLNPITVTVDNKMYTIVKSASLLTEPETYTETSIMIEDTEIPAFINETAGITLVGLKDELGEISLFKYEDNKYTKYQEINLNTDLLVIVPFTKEMDLIKTKITLNDTEIEVYKYNDKTDFVIINALNLLDGKTNLYLYDTVNKSALRYDETFINDTKETIKNYTYIIVAFGTVSIVMFITIISLLHSLSRKNKKIKNFLKKQEAKIEATRKLNDVVDEVKKITEQEEKAKNKKDKGKKKTNLEEEVVAKEIKVKDSKIVEEDTEVYNLFDEDKKQKKNKKETKE